MRHILKLAGVGVGLLVALAAHTWWFKPLRLAWFYDRTFVQDLVRSPMYMSSMGILDGTGLDWYSSQMSDFSVAAQDRSYARLHKEVKTFRSYDTSGLQGTEKITALVADYEYRDQLAREKWRWYGFPVNALFGLQSHLPYFMLNTHAIQGAGNAKDYVQRLRGFEKAFADVLADMAVREGKGLLPPRFSVTKTLAQMQAFIAPEPGQHTLVSHLRDKLAQLPAGQVSAGQADALVAEATEAVQTSVYPSYRKLIAYFEHLQTRNLNNEGVWHLPEGQAYYAYAVAHHTSTQASPAQLHATGLAEVARIGQEIDTILASQGLPGRSRAAKFAALRQRADQRYPDTDEGRASILRDYQVIIDEANQKLSGQFGLQPSAKVQVKRIPAFSEATAPGAFYESPSLDGSRPGVFFANLQNVAGTPKFGMRTLAYHEAIPGHHMQISVQMGLKNLPYFRRANGYTAYAEGWALYAERLAWEMGLQAAPLDNLGRLQAEMFRATRLVVDTGLHAMRWSREQAIAYMMAQTGMDVHEVTNEIERYLIDPGQALAYKVGMSKILALREWARQELGEAFRISAFHDTVLGCGAVPLDVLEVVVKDWVADIQKAQKTP